MNRVDIISAFLVLKEVIAKLSQEEKTALFARIGNVNPWYTPESIQKSFDGIVNLLDEAQLNKWSSKYPSIEKASKVGIIMAGNIPLVGFHDLLCVLISGHNAVVKLSSQDDILPKFIINELIGINNSFESRIEVAEKLNKLDAVIATGSDNSSRYFHKYFSHIPNIIRKNRTSIAVLDGTETNQDLTNLGEDIFTYFGMGCRNVSKLFIPEGFELTKLIDQLEQYKAIANHPKYFNNYEYNKAIYLVNRIEHLDNGFALFRQSQEVVSPLSVVYYEFYSSIEDLTSKLTELEDKLQCIVGHQVNIPNLIPFGKAQTPEIDDYADRIDTMEFLAKL